MIQLTKWQISLGFHRFAQSCPFSVPGYNSGYYIAFTCLDSFLSLCLLWPWDLWRLLESYFVKCPSIWVCHDFSCLEQDHTSWDEYHRSDVRFSVPDAWGTQCVCLITVKAKVPHLLRWCLLDFSSKILLCSSLWLLNIWGVILWGYTNILFLLKLSLTSFSWFILPAAVITMVS